MISSCDGNCFYAHDRSNKIYMPSATKLSNATLIGTVAFYNNAKPTA